MGNALAGRGRAFRALGDAFFLGAPGVGFGSLGASLAGARLWWRSADELRRVFEPESGGDVAEMKSLDVEYVFEFAREGGVRADVGAERILGQDVCGLSDATLARSFFCMRWAADGDGACS